MHMLRLALASIVALAAIPAAAQRMIEARQSEKAWILELQFGGYHPSIDDGLDQPLFDDAFGSSDRLITQLALQRQVFQDFGTVGIGFGTGYVEFYGKGVFAEGELAGQVSNDNDSFHVVPLQLFAMYRFDVTSERWNVPLVPYAKAGFGWWLWFTDDENGAKQGVSYGAGLQLLLDFFDPRLAREFDREIGVNNSFLYVDYTAWEAGWESDFSFDESGFDLSDEILSFGLALEF